jgi:hypothetical protein
MVESPAPPSAPGRSIAWWVAAAIVALGVSALGVSGGRALILRQRLGGCDELGARVDTVWTADARDLVQDGIRRSGAVDADAIAERTATRIDEFAARWHGVRTTACADAEVELTLEHAYYAQVTWCLDDALLGLEALLGDAARPSRATAYGSIDAAAGLPSPTACRRAAPTVRLPPLPEGSDRSHLREVRASVQTAAVSRGADRLDTAFAALAEAEAVGWAPLTSVAARVLCLRQAERGEFGLAAAACEQAHAEASAQALHDLAADAAIELVGIVGVGLDRVDEGRAWVRRAEVAIDGLAEVEGPRTVRWLAARGELARHAGDLETARADHDRALAIAEGQDAADPIVVALLDGLATDLEGLGDAAGALAARERAVAAAEATYGEGHPRVVSQRVALARLRGADQAAAEASRAAMALVRAWIVDPESIATPGR